MPTPRFQPENRLPILAVIGLILFIVFLLFVPDPTVLPNP